MSDYVGHGLGSRSAHRLLRLGRKPVADYHQQLIFEAHASERSHGVRRNKRKHRLIDLASIPTDVRARIQDSNATVPEFVLLRHHELRWRRIQRHFLIAAGVSTVTWAILNSQVAGVGYCAQGAVCPPLRPYDRVDVAGLTSIALFAITVALVAWTSRLHHRAEALEDKEAAALNKAAISRTPGWRPPL